MESKTAIKGSQRLHRIALFLASISLLAWVILPAVKTSIGLITFNQSFEMSNHQYSEFDEIQRKIQSHFKKYDTFIDPDDIIDSGNVKRLGIIQHKISHCLQKDLVVYVPVIIRLPFFGKGTFEWCETIGKE